MCGFSCEKDLELQRRGLEQGARDVKLFHLGLQSRRGVCGFPLHQIPHPDVATEQQQVLLMEGGLRQQALGTKHDRKTEDTAEGLGGNVENTPQHKGRKNRDGN